MKPPILVAIDFSDVTDALLDEAARLARAFDARVHLMHVDVAVNVPDFVGYDVGPVYMRTEIAHQIREEHRSLEALEQQLRDRGIDVTSMLVPGAPADKINETAEKLQPMFVLLGSHGHGQLYRLLAGSVRDGVLTKVRCPVVVVPPYQAREDDTEPES